MRKQRKSKLRLKELEGLTSRNKYKIGIYRQEIHSAQIVDRVLKIHKGVESCFYVLFSSPGSFLPESMHTFSGNLMDMRASYSVGDIEVQQ